MWKPTQTSNDVLMHSRGPWKKHKYIKVDANGNYIYPGDTINPARAAATALRRDVDTITARRRVEADRRNELNNRNLDAARNKAARKASAKRIAAENAERSRRSARLRDQRNAEGRLAARKQIAEGNRDRLIKNAFRETARGIVRTAKEKDKQRLSRLRDQRNAEGRLSTRKQIEAGNQRSRDEAARLRKLNAINTTRKAQKQGMARTDATRRAADLATARKAVEAGRRNELNNRNLEAARNKAARKASAKRIAAEEANKRRKIKSDNVNAGNLARARQKAKNAKNAQLREERNAAGRLSARKQIAEGNRKARLRDQRNAEGRIAARKQGVKLNDIAKKSTSLRMGSKAIYAQRSGDKAGAERYIKQKRIADKVYTEGLRRDYFGRDTILKKKDPNKLPARLDVAAKQAGNAISREAYRTGYKARKAASSAAKSISSAAREAWNTASSYRDKFADFESFYKWYKKNVRK